MKLELEFYHFHLRKCIWKFHSPKKRPFCPAGQSYQELSQWGLNKMVVNLQTTFLTVFSFPKKWLRFNWNLFLRVALKISQRWFGWWLGPYSAPSHDLNQVDDPVDWAIYKSPGLNDWNHETTLSPIQMTGYTIAFTKSLTCHQIDLKGCHIKNWGTYLFH